MSTKLIYAIGDVHGRLDLLDTLLAKIERDSVGAHYQLVFLGDYVDRGPQSREVIDRLLELRERKWTYKPVFLRGNHEETMRVVIEEPYDWDIFREWMHWGGDATIASYGVEVKHGAENGPALCDAFREAVGPAHRKFLNDLSYTFQTATHFYCHAGIDFDRPLNKQDKGDLLWVRRPFIESDKKAAKIIVHGHTITNSFRPEVHANRIAVDTGAYKSDNLTACRLQGHAPPGFVMTRRY